MHELVIIETGHIDARFKHEVSRKLSPDVSLDKSLKFGDITKSAH